MSGVHRVLPPSALDSLQAYLDRGGGTGLPLARSATPSAVIDVIEAGREHDLRQAPEDVGAWLVSNGWATALASGIYGKAEAVAKDAEMGIFGPPR